MLPTEFNLRLLLALVIVIVTVRAMGWLFARIGQPRLIGEICAGVVLGPSLLGAVAPEVTAFLFAPAVLDGLRALSQIGLVLFMFLVGLDVDVRALRGNGRTVAAVAHGALVVPFVLAVGLGLLVAPTFAGPTSTAAFCLFLGAAMAVTAFPVLAVLVQETGLAGTRIGNLSLICAAANDAIAWCLIAVVVALTGAMSLGDAAVTIGLAAVFGAGMVLVVRPLLARWSEPPMWAMLLLTVTSASVAEMIGLHAIIGAFLAGLVVPRTPALIRQTRERLHVVVSTLLLPVFFVVAGLSTRLDELRPDGLLLIPAVIVVAVAGKFGGAALAARAAGEPWREALTIGALMNSRGVTELVVLAMGLDLGLISSTIYTVMVVMALVTTMMTAPLVKLWQRQPPAMTPAAVAPATNASD